jgi:leucyl-tRNA synthetase
MIDRYEPAQFEAKWRNRWAEADLFVTREDSDRPKFYGLEFFPYPSGAGLSVGHCRNYVPTDVVCRKKAMEGYNVLHPMGFDAFGLPAENAAIKLKVHPAPMIDDFAANYRRQMDLVGIGYDWSRSFKSSDPEYYRWTQWIFTVLFERGLAYRRLAPVNWCPKDKTALANEEVVGGLCERCGTPVVKRDIPQWYFKITDYAQRLLDDLETIDWPEGIKQMQRNWIGRSDGVEFSMRVTFEDDPPPTDNRYDLESDEPGFERRLAFDAFTTRIDTIFGVTFCVLAPEHPLIESIAARVDRERAEKIRAYCEHARNLSDTDRQALTREKTGVFTGAYAVNPASGRRVPIWIADYVLMGYGTGAIMAVPGHDERDFEFATAFGLPVLPVIAPAAGIEPALPFPAKDGVLINSGEYDGMSVAEAQEALATWIEGLGIGRRRVNYKLRDWLISRQRYWGCPIPIIHSADGEMRAVAEKDLPVYLPNVESYEPTGDGESPLAAIPDFVNVTDVEGRLARRETDTMSGFACSSWYFLRFCDPHNDRAAWSPDSLARWMPVDCYVGGAEHAVMHLLYARFWTKVLFDAGYCPVSEPFARLLNQGQVLAYTPYRKPREGERLEVGEEGILVSFDEAATLGEDAVFWRWARMSKSKGNVVTPDDMVEQYGADALRLYLLFKAPFEADIMWENKGVEDLAKFLGRVFRLVSGLRSSFVPDWRERLDGRELDGKARELRRHTHQTIYHASEDIDRFAFNTYVAWLMKYLNAIQDITREGVEGDLALAASEAVETFVLLLAPGAPFSADEMWEGLGLSGFTYQATWPRWDPDLAKSDTVTIAVQVNGKLRDTLELDADAGRDVLEAAALASPKVAAHLDGKQVRKVIVVPGKLVNVVAG